MIYSDLQNQMGFQYLQFRIGHSNQFPIKILHCRCLHHIPYYKKIVKVIKNKQK